MPRDYTEEFEEKSQKVMIPEVGERDALRWPRCWKTNRSWDDLTFECTSTGSTKAKRSGDDEMFWVDSLLVKWKQNQEEEFSVDFVFLSVYILTVLGILLHAINFVPFTIKDKKKMRVIFFIHKRCGFFIPSIQQQKIFLLLVFLDIFWFVHILSVNMVKF